VERCNDLLGPGHLRYAPRVDEAGDLDRRYAGPRDPVRELAASVRAEDVRLVLEPVSRSDVDDRDAPAGLHAFTV
jgi:hypothetical protein